mmetsp:Transcript_39793/g.52095  ORF Transcript_39793/g.52095 Transcript_39793/m.52095 type:complete len:110 (+) Transcript_39793:1211-1540(+)
MVDSEIVDLVLINIIRQAQRLANLDSDIVLSYSISQDEKMNDSFAQEEANESRNLQLSFRVQFRVDLNSFENFEALRKSTFIHETSLQLSSSLCEILEGSLSFEKSENQ